MSNNPENSKSENSSSGHPHTCRSRVVHERATCNTRVVRPRDFRVPVVAPDCGPSRTKTNTGFETDINKIVSQYQKTGRFDYVNPQIPMYGDFTAANSLQEAMDLVQSAEDGFRSLPPSVRNVAGGDPTELLRMLATEDGRAALEEAGMEIVPASEAVPAERSEDPGALASAPEPSGVENTPPAPDGKPDVSEAP